MTMMARAVSVFFYGLYMDAEALRARGAHPANIRPAHIRGFTLIIGRRAAVVPERDGVVYGVVMDLTHDELDRLYADESLSVYKPEPVLCDAGADRFAALCFNLPVSPASDERNEDYARRLRALAIRLDLPATTWRPSTSRIERPASRRGCASRRAYRTSIA
jgi:Gamma-glutamyl cyclotransferase, AIG2-like